MKCLVGREGEIIGYLQNVDPALLDNYLQPPVASIVDVDRVPDVDSEFWDGQQLAPRKDFSLDALPLPCTVWIEDQEYRCHEQPEFVFDAPGTYEIHVDAGPQYLEKVFQYDYQP
jgi:hypothetical protein